MLVIKKFRGKRIHNKVIKSWNVWLDSKVLYEVERNESMLVYFICS